MATPRTQGSLTIADYYRMGETGELTEDDRVELIEGELVWMSPIGWLHMSCVNSLNRLFTPAVIDVADVSIQGPLRLNDSSQPEPDVVLFRRRNYTDIPNAADVILLIEVSDETLRYDRDRKMPLYAANGVPESWITDVKRKIIWRYREPSPDGYRVVEQFRQG